MTITTKRNLILAVVFGLSVWAIVWGCLELGKLDNFGMDTFAVMFMFAVLFGIFGAVMSGVALLVRIWNNAE